MVKRTSRTTSFQVSTVIRHSKARRGVSAIRFSKRVANCSTKSLEISGNGTSSCSITGCRPVFLIGRTGRSLPFILPSASTRRRTRTGLLSLTRPCGCLIPSGSTIWSIPRRRSYLTLRIRRTLERRPCSTAICRTGCMRALDGRPCLFRSSPRISRRASPRSRAVSRCMEVILQGSNGQPGEVTDRASRESGCFEEPSRRFLKISMRPALSNPVFFQTSMAWVVTSDPNSRIHRSAPLLPNGHTELRGRKLSE